SLPRRRNRHDCPGRRPDIRSSPGMPRRRPSPRAARPLSRRSRRGPCSRRRLASRSEEHTSELQSRFDLVCRLLLEKKKKNNTNGNSYKKIESEECSGERTHHVWWIQYVIMLG